MRIVLGYDKATFFFRFLGRVFFLGAPGRVLLVGVGGGEGMQMEVD